MFGYADVEKLRKSGAPGAAVLSLYLPVPLEPAGIRGLAAEAGAAMAGAAQAGGVRHGNGAGVSPADREAVLHRCPDYRVVIADHEHAWVLAVNGGQVETIARRVDPAPRSPGFGGWHAPARRVQQRVIQLGRRHYQDIAGILAQADSGQRVPLVIGGHRDSIAGLLRALPAAARESFAGSFHADPHTLTEAKARELADPVIDGWTGRRGQKIAEEILGTAPGRLTAVGVPTCLAAVGKGAVARLLLPEEGMVPGFACDRCGALATADGTCPDCGTALRSAPDLLEEMAQRALDDHSQVTVISDAPFTVAAKLRFPVTGGGSE